jgi:hypothetical protein
MQISIKQERFLAISNYGEAAKLLPDLPKDSHET